MATAKWSAPGSESANIAGTVLNVAGGIANGTTTAIIADIDNTTAKDLYVSFWLELASLTPTSGGSVTIRLRRKRSSTYEDSAGSYESMTKALTTSASAKYVSFNALRLPGPYVFGIELVNNSGVTIAASGNSLYYQTHNEDVA